MLWDSVCGETIKLRTLALMAALVLAPVAIAQEAATEQKAKATPEATAEDTSEEQPKAKAAEEPKQEAEPKEKAEKKEAAAEEPKEEATAEKAEEKKTVKKPRRRFTRTKKPKEPEPTKARYAEFVLDGPLPESPGGSGPFSELSIDLRKQIVRIDQAAQDDKVAGMVLRLREPAFGRGQVNELREAIARFRAEGKKAIAELEIASGGSYLVACACDEIVMPESGFMLLTGVRAEPLFYKGLLAKIGVKADFVHVGEAKGAAEPFTRRKWSEPVKENMESLIDDLYDQMVDTITMDRPMKRQTVVDAIDHGLMTAGDALERGLIDRLAYSGSLRERLQEEHGVDKVAFVRNYGKEKVDTDFSGPTGFFKLLGMMAGGSKGSSRSGDRISIVYAVGPIMTGESEVDPFGQSDSVGSTTVVEALQKAADDDRTAAIVLRVNSPGGSAVASDLIWRKIQEIKKPVVASMGDVAASGGYYISMGADKIYAEPTTVTGSIGVVGGKLAMKGMLDKIGVTSDLISRGKNSGLFSAMNKFSDSERDAIMSLMNDTYDQFTAKAADGRGLTQERVKELGGGRVYTGKQAKRLGLIDELGDLRAAITEAKRLAGLDEDKEVKIKTYPEAVDFFESLFGNTEAEREVRLRLDLGGAAPELEEAVGRLGMLRRLFTREPVAVLMPYELRIEQ